MGAMVAFTSFWRFFLKIFRKIKRVIRKKILMLINPQIRKKLMAFGNIRKRRKLVDELSRLIIKEEKGEKITPRLIWKVMIGEKSLSQTGLQVFLNYPELPLNDVFDAAENIPSELPEPEKENLENILWDKAKEMGLMTEDLFEIIISGPLAFREKARNEIEERIKNDNIRKKRAKSILKRLMDEVPELRIPMCELFMELKPSSDELKKLLDSRWMNFLPNLARKIETMIRTTYEKEKAEKKIETAMEKKITNILEKISKL